MSSTIGDVALKKTTEGESIIVSKNGRRFDCNRFFKFIISWLVVFLTMYGVLLIVAFVKGNPNFVFRAFGSVDSFNVSFSLALSAFLENLWNNEKKDRTYKFLLCFSGFAVLWGLLFYVTYSLLQVTSPTNVLLEKSGAFNLVYVIYSEVCVVLGFVRRSLDDNNSEKERG